MADALNPVVAVVSDDLAAISANSAASIPAGSNLIGHVDGAAASGANVTGNPLRIGAQARSTNLSTKSSGNVVDSIATLVGAIITRPYSIPEAEWTYAAGSNGIANTTTAVTMVAAAGSGIRNYLTCLHIAHDTLGAATEIVIRDGAAGTVIWRSKLQTAASENIKVVFPSPLRSTANTLMEVATISAVTGGVFVNASGFQAP